MPSKYRVLIENMPDAFAYHQMIFDSNGNPEDYVFLDVNPAFEMITGLQKEKIIGKRVTEVHPDIKESKFNWIATYSRVAARGESIRFNQYFELSRQMYAITAYSDKPGYFVTIFRDITEHDHLQEELQIQKSKLTKLLGFQEEMLKTAVIWINIFDEHGNVVMWNKAAEQISGYTAAEVVGHDKIWEWVCPNPDYNDAIVKRANKIIYKGDRVKNFETQIRRKDGQYRTILWYSNSLIENGITIGFIAVGADITERKQMERNLRNVSAEYEKVFQGTQNAMFLVEVVNPNTFRYIRTNQAHEKLTGISAENIRGKTPQELVGKSLGNHVALNYSKCLQSASPISYKETLDLPGGKRTWFTTLTPIFSEGKITYLVGSSQDITERKQAERLLRASEERYRLLVENANDAIVVIQADYIKYANPRTLQLYACSAKEINSIPFAELVHPDDWHLIQEHSQQRLRGNKLTQPLHFRIIARDGKIKFISKSSVKIKWEGHSAILAIMTDITELKKMEEEMLKADRLDSIGILAGGIAHDFNNYLATLLANISLAKLHKDDGAKIEEKLANMEKATLRAKDLSNQLFTFAQGGVPLREKISIRQLIMDNINFALSGSQVYPDIIIDADLHTVEADAGQLSQVLNNITINAVQGMPEGGTLVIRVENVDLAAADGNSPVPLPAGPCIKITIRDTGMGIPEKYLQKIFDPFFTTKEKGRGLGLATSYSIIKKHGGHIGVESAAGMGASFTIFLPAIAEVDNIQSAGEEVLQGTGKILIMDDEEDLLSALGETLSALGYGVTLSRDGGEAIKLYTRALEQNHPFDLVILDLTIPGGMGGKQTIKKLLKKDPAVKAIVVTGYSNGPVMANYHDFGFKGLLRKPFTLEELSKAVGEVIRQK